MLIKELMAINEMASADELVSLTNAFVKVGHDSQMEGPIEDADGKWSMFSDELYGDEIQEKLGELKAALTKAFSPIATGFEWSGDGDSQVGKGSLASKTSFEIEMNINEEGESHGGNIVVILKV